MAKANLSVWSIVDVFYLRDAAFLWFNLEPEPGDLPPAVRSFCHQLYEYWCADIEENGDPWQCHDRLRPVEIGEERWLFFLIDRSALERIADAWVSTVGGTHPAFLCSDPTTHTSDQPLKFDVVSEQTYLNIIEALLHLVVMPEGSDKGQACQRFASQTALINYINDRHSDVLKGLSEGNLGKVFAAANKLKP